MERLPLADKPNYRQDNFSSYQGAAIYQLNFIRWVEGIVTNADGLQEQIDANRIDIDLNRTDIDLNALAIEANTESIVAGEADIASINVSLAQILSGEYWNGQTVVTTGDWALGSLALTTDLAILDGGTGASDAATALANLGGAPLTRDLAAGVGLDGGGDLTADRTFDLADTAVVAGSYTTTDLTVDAQGRITAASNGSAGSSLSVEDDGVEIVATADTLNFSGAAVTSITESPSGQANIVIESGIGGAVELVQVFDLASDASEIDVPLTGPYGYYKLVLSVSPASDTPNLMVRVTEDNFSTVETGASDYSWVDQRNDVLGNSTNNADDADSEIRVATNQGNAAGESLEGTLDVYGAGDSNRDTSIQTLHTRMNGANGYNRGYGAGRYQAQSVVNGVRIYFSSGDVASGSKVYLYGYRSEGGISSGTIAAFDGDQDLGTTDDVTHNKIFAQDTTDSTSPTSDAALRSSGGASIAKALHVGEGASVGGTLTALGKLNLGLGSTLTLTSGTVSITEAFHRLDTEGAASTDDCTDINGGTTGDILALLGANSARDVTLVDNTGNLRLAGDFTFNNVQATILLIRDGSIWKELTRSTNA